MRLSPVLRRENLHVDAEMPVDVLVPFRWIPRAWTRWTMNGHDYRRTERGVIQELAQHSSVWVDVPVTLRADVGVITTEGRRATGV